MAWMCRLGLINSRATNSLEKMMKYVRRNEKREKEK